jgi:hypothetical protein
LSIEGDAVGILNDWLLGGGFGFGEVGDFDVKEGCGCVGVGVGGT